MMNRRQASGAARWILAGALGLAGCGGAEVKPPPGVEDSATSLDVSIDGGGDAKPDEKTGEKAGEKADDKADDKAESKPESKPEVKDGP